MEVFLIIEYRRRKKSQGYRLTEDEENFVIGMSGIRLADESTAYDIALQKINELEEKGIYIDPERIPILLAETRKLIRSKGAPGRGRGSFFTSSKTIY